MLKFVVFLVYGERCKFAPFTPLMFVCELYVIAQVFVYITQAIESGIAVVLYD